MSTPGNPPPNELNLFLTGFMGSGKTTIGKALANRLNWRFVDVDIEIERDSGMTVAQLFAFRGEQEFRAIESKKLVHLCQLKRQVVALGGGTILMPENRALMARMGKLIYLRTSTDTLVRRLYPRISKRPLLAGVKTPEELRLRIEKIREERESLYAAAPLIVDCDVGSPDELAFKIEEELK